MVHPSEALEKISAAGLLRKLTPLDSPPGIQISRNGRSLWNFASNDYLGFSQHPRIINSLLEGVKRYGAGATASRLVCGTLPPHRALEEKLAEVKQSESALTFTSGFAVALGIIPAIAGKQDFVILDKLCHACLIDGARLSGATIRIFPHNDLAGLERLLQKLRSKSNAARILVITESVFSMDGDLAPLTALVSLVERFEALLLVDEAHAFGVLGNNGMGLAEQEGLQGRISFQMGTFSKAVGLSGGYVTASREWIDLFINQARTLIYSTAPPPALAHAVCEAIDVIRSPDGKALRDRLQTNIRVLSKSGTPIIPVITGCNSSALAASAKLEAQGFLVPAIRYPTVPRNSARLRVSISAAHPIEAVQLLSNNLVELRS